MRRFGRAPDFAVVGVHPGEGDLYYGITRQGGELCRKRTALRDARLVEGAVSNQWLSQSIRYQQTRLRCLRNSGKAVAQVSIHPSEDGQLRGGMVHGRLAEMPTLVVGIDDFN